MPTKVLSPLAARLADIEKRVKALEDRPASTNGKTGAQGVKGETGETGASGKKGSGFWGD
jgi:hypothetical protein